MPAAKELEFNISSAEWFRANLLYPNFGISAEAARKYRERGIWLEGKHFRRDPLGMYVYCRTAITRWMEGHV